MARLHRIVRVLAQIVPEQQIDAGFERGHVPCQQEQIEYRDRDRSDLGDERPLVLPPCRPYAAVSSAAWSASRPSLSEVARRCGSQGRYRLAPHHEGAGILQIAEEAARAFVPRHGLGVGAACGARQAEALQAGGAKILVEDRHRRAGDDVAGRIRPESRRSAGRSRAPRAGPARRYRCGSGTRTRPRSRRRWPGPGPCGFRGKSPTDSAAPIPAWPVRRRPRPCCPAGRAPGRPRCSSPPPAARR